MGEPWLSGLRRLPKAPLADLWFKSGGRTFKGWARETRCPTLSEFICIKLHRISNAPKCPVSPTRRYLGPPAQYLSVVVPSVSTKPQSILHSPVFAPVTKIEGLECGDHNGIVLKALL